MLSSLLPPLRKSFSPSHPRSRDETGRSESSFPPSLPGGGGEHNGDFLPTSPPLLVASHLAPDRSVPALLEVREEDCSKDSSQGRRGEVREWRECRDRRERAREGREGGREWKEGGREGMEGRKEGMEGG